MISKSSRSAVMPAVAGHATSGSEFSLPHWLCKSRKVGNRAFFFAHRLPSLRSQIVAFPRGVQRIPDRCDPRNRYNPTHIGLPPTLSKFMYLLADNSIDFDCSKPTFSKILQQKPLSGQLSDDDQLGPRNRYISGWRWVSSELTRCFSYPPPSVRFCSSTCSAHAWR